MTHAAPAWGVASRAVCGSDGTGMWVLTRVIGG
jgi:hypothetical protein